MDKIRLAIVEDDKDILKDRCENLDQLKDECETVIKASNSEDFFTEYNKNPCNVDALILDINLDGSKYSGIQIAAKVKKPLLFMSDYNAQNLRAIEELSDIIKVVMHITKPVSDERFKNKVRDFCNEIRMRQQFYNQILTFKREGMPVRIPANDIVFLESISDGSNNKVIYFKSNKPLQLNDMSFLKILNWCQNTAIVQISKGYYVNKEHIESKEQGVVNVSYMNREGKSVNRALPVSPNYVKNIR